MYLDLENVIACSDDRIMRMPDALLSGGCMSGCREVLSYYMNLPN